MAQANLNQTEVRTRFLECYSNIQREGADKLLAWLNASDFFVAPASTKYHLNCEGGLALHSLNVYTRLLALLETEKHEFPADTVAICGLLHDICKIGVYHVEMRNKKDESGKWIQVPYYTYEDKLPYGHGEKSEYIVSKFIPSLTREESIAIRWHMGFSDPSFKGGDQSVGNAFNLYPLATMLHLADMQATYLDERPVAL